MSIVNGKGADAKWEHLMLDLETLGNKPGAVITQIAAVPFNWDNKNVNAEDSFEIKINVQSSLDRGMFIQANTLEWWSKQNPEVYKKMIDQSNTVNITNALFQFKVYLQSLYPSQLKIWGNSNRFDLGLLAAAYDLFHEKEYPWYFRNERDVRTLVDLNPLVKANHVWKGNLHDPIADCLNQIDYLCETKNTIKIRI